MDEVNLKTDQTGTPATFRVDLAYLRHQGAVALASFVSPLSGILVAAFGPGVFAKFTGHVLSADGDAKLDIAVKRP